MTERRARTRAQAGNKAFELIGDFLSKDGWSPERIEGQDVYRVRFDGENDRLVCLAVLHEKFSQFVFYAAPSSLVPVKARKRVAEFVTRANYGLPYGNFEFDLGDGDLRFKTSIDFEDEKLTKGLVKNAVYQCVLILDRYGAALKKVIAGDATPEKAVDEVESGESK